MVHVTPPACHQHMKWSSSILHSVSKHESDSELALGTRTQAWTRRSMPAKGPGGGGQMKTGEADAEVVCRDSGMFSKWGDPVTRKEAISSPPATADITGLGFFRGSSAPTPA